MRRVLQRVVALAPGAALRLSRISAWMAIIASQKRSSSSFDSLSVGSTISVPATGKRQRRRVEAVVHQPLRDVLGVDAAALLQLAQIEDALVRDAAVRAVVEHREVRREPRRDVVRVEDRDLGGACGGPLAPIMRMYIHEMGRISALPNGAADTGRRVAAGSTTGCAGRNGARCAATAIGPMPGPPPPCGMQKVLCRLRWQTSAPISRRAWQGRPARSCWRRPCRPGRRAACTMLADLA